MFISATSAEKVRNLTQAQRIEGNRIKNWDVKITNYILHIVYIFMCNL